LEDEVDAAQAHYAEQLVRMQHINTVPLASPYSYRLRRIQHAMRHPGGSPPSASADVMKFQAETEKDREVLSQLGLTLESDICMILGRLFKLHPEFDEILVSIILGMEAEGTGRGAYIVLVAESLIELNTLIYDRLGAALSGRLGGGETGNAQSAALMREYVRVVGYSRYHALLRAARVVLDTFPYGGRTSLMVCPVFTYEVFITVSIWAYRMPHLARRALPQCAVGDPASGVHPVSRRIHFRHPIINNVTVFFSLFLLYAQWAFLTRPVSGNGNTRAGRS
jgi:hypothetical protein